VVWEGSGREPALCKAATSGRVGAHPRSGKSVGYPAAIRCRRITPVGASTTRVNIAIFLLGTVRRCAARPMPRASHGGNADQMAEIDEFLMTAAARRAVLGYTPLHLIMTQDVPSKTFSQLLWVSAVRIALVGTWFLATVLIGRTLGVVAFGFFVYCQTLIKFVTGCLGDPLDMAVMRQGPILLRTDRPALLQLLRSAFFLRLVIGMAMLLLALAVPSLASGAMFSNPNFKAMAVLTAAGVLGDFLLRSALGYFQIGENFGRFIAVDAVWQSVRVVAVVLLVLLHRLTDRSAVAIYVFAPWIAFAAGWFLLPADVRKPALPHRKDLLDIFHYGKWVVIGLAMAAAYEQLDKLLLVHLRGDRELGIYAAALTWAVIPDFINGILQTVLGPRIAPAYAQGRFNALQKQYLSYAVPAGVAFGIIAMLIAGWVIRVFMSAAYLPAVGVYRVLIIGTLFNTVVTPLPEALMNFIAPRRVILCTALALIWVLVGGYSLIPRHGAMGAAVTIVSARLLVGSIIVWQAHRLAGRVSNSAGNALTPV
jgi:O-antigen/teichoic acid export membrane protein